MAVGKTTPPPASADPRVLVQIDDNTAMVSLSHPGRMNALTVSMWQELTSVFRELSLNQAIRCIVIRGAGEHFAAGADISEFPRYRHDHETVRHYHTNILAPALDAIARCPHPVIARIQGVCVGGGLEIASQCDLRIAADNTRLGVPINRLGFPMAPAEMRGLLRLAGPATTLEILLEGRLLDASEALAKGLLTRVVHLEALDEAIQASVDRVSLGAPLAARINKETVRRLTTDPVMLSSAELDALFRYADTHDHHEGIQAFLAGRPPQFSGE